MARLRRPTGALAFEFCLLGSPKQFQLLCDPHVHISIFWCILHRYSKFSYRIFSVPVFCSDHSEIKVYERLCGTTGYKFSKRPQRCREITLLHLRIRKIDPRLQVLGGVLELCFKFTSGFRPLPLRPKKIAQREMHVFLFGVSLHRGLEQRDCCVAILLRIERFSGQNVGLSHLRAYRLDLSMRIGHALILLCLGDSCAPAPSAMSDSADHDQQPVANMEWQRSSP